MRSSWLGQGTMSRWISEVWVFFGDGSGDLGFWSGWYGEREADSTTSFLFWFSLEGLGLSPNNIVFDGRIGGNNGGVLCGCEDSNKLGNILGGGVKNGSDSGYLWRLLVYS